MLAQIPPKAHGYSRNRETFTSRTGPVWDYYSAIETAVQFPLMFLLNVDRANRLVMFNDINADQPGLAAVLDRLIDKTWKSASTNPKDRGIQRIVEWVMLEHMMMIGNHKSAQADTKSIARMKLQEISTFMGTKRTTDSEERAHISRVTDAIDKWIDEPGKFQYTPALKAPDGSPIGDGGWMDFCSGTTEKY